MPSTHGAKEGENPAIAEGLGALFCLLITTFLGGNFMVVEDIIIN